MIGEVDPDWDYSDFCHERPDLDPPSDPMREPGNEPCDRPKAWEVESSRLVAENMELRNAIKWIAGPVDGQGYSPPTRQRIQRALEMVERFEAAQAERARQ